MLSLAGPYLAATALLALGGLLKVARPSETANALAALHLPAHAGLVRTLGLAEVAIGTMAFATSFALAAVLTALAYLGFAGFVLLARRSGTPVQSCGCFGKAETPPSVIHIVVNLTAALIAALVAWKPIPSLGRLLADQPGAGIPLLMLTALTVYLLYIMLTVLPQTLNTLRLS
jgi:hypothetical protein